jgi:hypothetical protein
MRMKRNLILVVMIAEAIPLGLLATQATNQKDMNSWPYSKVKQAMSNPQTA